MALGSGVHNLSLVVRAHNRATRALHGVSRDLALMDKTRQTVQTGFKQMGNVGAAAIKTMAIAVGVAIGGAIFAFSSFDAAMTQSLAIAENVSPAIEKQLSDTAREVAKTTIFSANEAAEAYFHLFSAGQDAAQAMKNLPLVAQFAQAGLFDLETATELLVTAQNALGLAFEDPIKNAKEMRRVADVLAAADERAVGTIEEFAEALTNRAAASMRTYNIEVEEGVAVLAAWATQGLKGRTAGEAFAIVVRDLQKAALAEADAWREADAAVFDSQGNLRNLADIVRDLEDAMRGLTDAEKKQLLQDLGFQERSQQRILQLIGTSDAIRQFEEDFKQAGGTVEEISNKQLQTATKQLGLLKDAIIDVFIGSGEKLDEGFVNIISKIREFVNKHGPSWVEKVGEIVESVEEFGINVRLLWHHFASVNDGLDRSTRFIEDRMGPAVAKLVGWIDELIGWWRELSQPVKDAVRDWSELLPWIFLAAGAFKIVGTVLALLGGPATLIAGIIAGLIVLFQYLWENSEEFRAVVGEVAAYLEEVVWPTLKEFWEAIQEAAVVFMEYFQTELLPSIIEIWDQIKETFDAAWEFIVALWETASELLTDIWETWGDDIFSILKIFWDQIVGFIKGAWQILEGIFKFFTGLLTGDWKKLWDGISEIFNGFYNIFYSVFSGAWDAVASFLNGMWEGIKKSWKRLWEDFKDAVRGPLNWVLERLESFVNRAIGILNGLIGAANKIPGVNIGKIPTISLPKLAIGGDVIRQGLAIVGENGPELLALGKGAQVAPLGSTASANIGAPSAMGGFHVDQIVFQGTPSSMLEDWRTYSRLALKGL